jgi:hypothetical protein
MNFSDLGKAISNFAPLLGTVVGGAPGAVMGSIVASAFGGVASNPQDLIAKIQGDPDAGAKLAEIESNCKIELQRIAMQMAENEFDFQNTKDAREKNTESKTMMPQILSIVVLIGFFACIWVILMYKQDAEDHDVLYMMLGGEVAAFQQMLQYWLGSSSSSKFKDTLLRKG